MEVRQLGRVADGSQSSTFPSTTETVGAAYRADSIQFTYMTASRMSMKIKIPNMTSQQRMWAHEGTTTAL